MKNAVLIITLVICNFWPRATGAIDFEKVAIQLDHLNGPVYQVTQGPMAAVNSCISIGPDGMLLVDGGHGPLSDRILGQIGQWIQAPATRFVINTHWHGDHAGANEYFGKTAVVISHDNVRSRLESQPVLEIRDGTTKLNAEGLPDITYMNRMSVYFNEEEVQIFHIPASHTDGDSVVYFTDSDVACLGDMYQSGAFPLVDRDSGGDLGNYLTSLGLLSQRFGKNTIMVPGHWQTTNLWEFDRWRARLATTVDFVREAKNQGLTVDQTIKVGLPEKFDDLATRPRFVSEENWIRAVYDYLETSSKNVD